MPKPRSFQGSLLACHEIGIFAIGPHKPASDMLDDPLFRGGDAPSSVEAMLLRDFKKAIKGDERALKRMIKRLRTYDLAQMRKHNASPTISRSNENEAFERIDDVLKLLGIVVDMEHPGNEFLKTGLADWAFDEAAARPDCPRRVVGEVSNWIDDGCPGLFMRINTEDTEWSWA